MPRRSLQALVAFSTCMACIGTVQAATFSVTNLDDSGAGTLREAIELANDNQGADTIEFNAGNGTILLSDVLPELTGDVDITGPGAEIITIDGQFQHRPFSVSSGSTVTLTGLTIANGRSSLVGSGGTGGGIHNEGDLTVTDCVLSNNHADSDGGAIRNVDGSLWVIQGTLFGNTTGEGGVGAGIYNSGGTVNIIESTFAENTAGYGGAIYNQGSAIIVASTLTANRAVATDAFGGAIENLGTLTVSNSTLSANVANIEGVDTTGGGIDNYRGKVTVEFSTLTENSSISGGGISNGDKDPASFSIKNSLVVNSAAGNNCVNDGGTFTALGVNFATDDSCPEFTQTTAGEVNLGPLADNGGPTQTHALLSGSVAIDAALDCTLSDGTALNQDQRGYSRPTGDGCDSGAFEVFDIIFRDGFENQ